MTDTDPVWAMWRSPLSTVFRAERRISSFFRVLEHRDMEGIRLRLEVCIFIFSYLFDFSYVFSVFSLFFSHVFFLMCLFSIFFAQFFPIVYQLLLLLMKIL